MTFVTTVAGFDCSVVRLSVGGSGPWFADCTPTQVQGALPSGAVSLVIGDTTLSGTVDPSHSGDFGERRCIRVIAGGGGWGKLLLPRDYANDAGVKAALVIADAATAVGERIGATTTRAFPAHYTRTAGPASRTIADAAAPDSWWVDYGGVTQIGKRFAVPAGPGARVLEYEPGPRRITAAVDSLTDIVIGSTLTDPLWTGTLTVASLEISVGGDGMRLTAWCGAGVDPVLDPLRGLIGQLMPSGLLGTYRYRVIRMNADRVDLQVVSKANGVPDLATVDMWPGLSGAHSVLTSGTHVAVQFLDGDRSQPIISSFVGRAGPGQTPQAIELGGPNGSGVATIGNTVDVLWPPMVFTGTIGGSPATGVVTAMTGKTIGTISSGSVKVKAANG